jgi:hypothetical protein
MPPKSQFAFTERKFICSSGFEVVRLCTSVTDITGRKSFFNSLCSHLLLIKTLITEWKANHAFMQQVELFSLAQGETKFYPE